MADKTTTLKTKTNDNVYPNVIGDNRKNAFVDSSTIKHHFYDQTHKVGFQIANETNIKIQNSLQKPSGLTKTELVGVGTNGQENIEIGDSLNLKNGKLDINSNIISFFPYTLFGVDITNKTYTGKFGDINYPVLMTIDNKLVLSSQTIDPSDHSVTIDLIRNGIYEHFTLENNEVKEYFSGSIITSQQIAPLVEMFQFKIYSHFITMTDSASNVALYLTIQNTYETELTADSLATYLADKKVLANGNIHGVVPTYIAGEGGVIKVYYRTPGDSNINPTPDEYQDLSSFTITDLVTPVE